MSYSLVKNGFSCAVFVLATLPLRAQPVGNVTGQIRDFSTKRPLIGATVFIEAIGRGAASGSDGSFTIGELPVGAYTIRFSFVGYESQTETDVIVRPDRTTFTDVELKPVVLDAAEAVVTAGVFGSRSDPGNIVARDAEEIRRAPGAAGDVSRALTGLPSVGKVNDLRNGLVVRGGSPMENGFYLDGMQIENINHFPTQGTSSGAIALVNADLIRNVRFQSGGFSSTYGNRLSSVMNLVLREGNREETEFQMDLNLGGFGFVAEGPLDTSGSSWILSARRSYLDFLVNHLMGDEVDAVPTYGDAQGKAVLNLTPKSRVVIIALLGIDLSGIDRSSAKDEDENSYGDADYTLGTVGASWRYLFGSKGFTTTYLSYGLNRTSIDFNETLTGNASYGNHSCERVLRFRQVTSLVGSENSLEFGADGEIEFGSYELFYAAETDPLGQVQSALRIDDRLRTGAAGIFGTYSRRISPRLSIAPGVRLDYASSNHNLLVSPRFGAVLDLGDRTSITLSAGRYRQRLPTVLVAQSASHADLPNMSATHYVANFSRLLSENTKLSVEGFVKNYEDFPMDSSQTELFVVDELFYRNGSIESFGSHPALVSSGAARSAGIELMLQKKLARRLYGLVSASFSRSRYRDLSGRWRSRVTDNRVMATVEGGYKPNRRWEFSLRWLYAGGAPYTPFDVAASELASAGIYDLDQINGVRLPDYHSLSLRADRRFLFTSSSLTAYLSIWNAYGRRNVAGYYWNEVDARVQAVEQFGTLPILGFEFEF